MVKTRKNKVALLAAAVTAFGLGGVATLDIVTQDVNANTTYFETVEKASVRYSDPTGLRFKVKFDEQTKADIVENENVTLGALIFPASSLPETTVGYDYMTGIAKKVNVEIDESKIYTLDGAWYANAVLADVYMQNLNIEFVCVGYIKTVATETTYKYSTLPETNYARSISYVAQAAIDDGDENTTLPEIIEKASFAQLGVTETREDGVSSYVFNENTYTYEQLKDVVVPYTVTANGVTLEKTSYVEGQTVTIAGDTSVLTSKIIRVTDEQGDVVATLPEKGGSFEMPAKNVTATLVDMSADLGAIAMPFYEGDVSLPENFADLTVSVSGVNGLTESDYALSGTTLTINKGGEYAVNCTASVNGEAVAAFTRNAQSGIVADYTSTSQYYASAGATAAMTTSAQSGIGTPAFANKKTDSYVAATLTSTIERSGVDISSVVAELNDPNTTVADTDYLALYIYIPAGDWTVYPKIYLSEGACATGQNSTNTVWAYSCDPGTTSYHSNGKWLSRGLLETNNWTMIRVTMAELREGLEIAKTNNINVNRLYFNISNGTAGSVYYYYSLEYVKYSPDLTKTSAISDSREVARIADANANVLSYVNVADTNIGRPANALDQTITTLTKITVTTNTNLYSSFNISPIIENIDTLNDNDYISIWVYLESPEGTESPTVRSWQYYNLTSGPRFHISNTTAGWNYPGTRTYTDLFYYTGWSEMKFTIAQLKTSLAGVSASAPYKTNFLISELWLNNAGEALYFYGVEFHKA